MSVTIFGKIWDYFTFRLRETITFLRSFFTEEVSDVGMLLFLDWKAKLCLSGYDTGLSEFLAEKMV